MKIPYVSRIFISFVMIQNFLPTTTLAGSGEQMKSNQGQYESVLDTTKSVIFKDSDLEEGVRKALQIPSTKPVTTKDMLKLTSLSARGRNITTLTGIEHAHSLQVVNFRDNIITDVSPLSKLTNLTELNLQGNRISNISNLDYIFAIITYEMYSLGNNTIVYCHDICRLPCNTHPRVRRRTRFLLSSSLLFPRSPLPSAWPCCR